MGTIAARLFRPLKNWNVENRAHKVISKEKPEPAPSYNSKKKQINLVNQLEPDYKINSQLKDVQLDDYLKKVYVKSNIAEVPATNLESNDDKQLPKDKSLQDGFEYGFYESPKVEVGKISLRQTIEMLKNHNTDPKKYSINYLAESYKIDKKLVGNILEYYKIFEMAKIEHKNSNDVLATPLVLSTKSGIRIPHTEKKKNAKKKTIEEKEESNVKRIERT